jgi:hypothetical protein
VGSCDFLIKFLGELMDTQMELFGRRPKRNLGKNLVRKRAGHNKRRMTVGTTTAHSVCKNPDREDRIIPQVDQMAIGKENYMTPIGHRKAINLGFDTDDRVSISLEPANINFIAKVAYTRGRMIKTLIIRE